MSPALVARIQSKTPSSNLDTLSPHLDDRHGAEIRFSVGLLTELTRTNVFRLDCRHVETISPVALSGLVDLTRRIERLGGKFQLVGLQPHLRRLMNLSGLTEILDLRAA